MSKQPKKAKAGKISEKNKPAQAKQEIKIENKKNDEYLFKMSCAPSLETSSHWFQMLPVLFFSACVIIITRMTVYERPMGQFFWSNGDSDLTEFFSYYKMGAILACTVFALVFLLYRVFIQSFYIKRSYVYIPMIVYAVFVLLSYFFSDYKLFALWGWNDRFEGTLILLSYMVMLFYVINTINSERNVKLLISALAAVSTLLGLLGLSQALDHDFFQTTIGKKLITPSWFWDQLDNLNFTFQNKEIYQTVYNINYVSFYLTLLIPLFGLLFIRSVMLGKDEPLYKKLLWGALFTLLLYNLIGSASSSGLMGMALVVLLAIFVLNKRIIHWIKPVAILLIITLIVSGVSYQRWSQELSSALRGVAGGNAAESNESGSARHKLDYIETSGNDIVLGYNGEKLIFTTYPDDPAAVSIFDSRGSAVTAAPTEDSSVFQIDDERYGWISVKPARDSDGNNYIVLMTDGHEWPFQITEGGPKYFTGLGGLIDLKQIESIGFENNGSWGNGRGYIWSRSFPMIKDTLILGNGADTYCIYFPHDDYAGKYNSGSYSDNINIIVDKPHNMYIGMAINTGVISLLALLALWGIYIVQSFMIYRRERYDRFISYVGSGIFLGISGFLAAGMVNDSSVSVMPMFYGLLGTGIAINIMLKRKLT
ncbi:MAG: O-antigen ligase family protein [Eubacteriales bacterium]|nr:O-antigen ligase family protein [Eubacteriales bacterium]